MASKIIQELKESVEAIALREADLHEKNAAKFSEADKIAKPVRVHKTAVITAAEVKDNVVNCTLVDDECNKHIMEFKTRPTVKDKRPPVFSATKQHQHLLSDFAQNKVRDGQSIGVIALRLFESALTWELTNQHPDKKSHVIASVMAVTNWNDRVDDALTNFFAAVKTYRLGLPNGYVLPWVVRFREYNSSAEMRAPNVDAVSGAVTGLMLAMRFDKGITNRANKLADNFQEVNSHFVKAGYEGAPALILTLITQLYKVAN